MKPVKDATATVKAEDGDALAIQALFRGEADSYQQQRAVKWIIEQAAKTFDQSFFPGGEEGRRNTDFSEGRRFVGNLILGLSNVSVSEIWRRRNVQANSPASE